MSLEKRDSLEQAAAQQERIAMDTRQKLNAEKQVIEKTKAVVKGWVESFEVKNLSKKAQAYLKDKNFVQKGKFDLEDGWFSWNWIAYDKNENLHFGKAFYIRYTDLQKFYTNWKFDQVRFTSFMNNYLGREADKYYTGKADKLVKWLGAVNVSSVATEKGKVTHIQNEIKKYESYWVIIPATYKKTIENKKNQIKIVEDYKWASKWANTKMTTLIANLDSKRDIPSRNALVDFCNELKKHSAKTPIGKNIYDAYHKIVNGDSEYEALRMKWFNKAKEYEPKTLE